MHSAKSMVEHLRAQELAILGFMHRLLGRRNNHAHSSSAKTCSPSSSNLRAPVQARRRARLLVRDRVERVAGHVDRRYRTAGDTK